MAFGSAPGWWHAAVVGLPCRESLVLPPVRRGICGLENRKRDLRRGDGGDRMWAVWLRVRAGLRQDWRGLVVLALITALMGAWFWLRWRGRAGLIRRFPVSCSTRARPRGR